MAEKNVSIFNDVLGPVITGPSSSNTAGALRAARMIRALLPDFKSAVVYVDTNPGGFAFTMEGLKSGVAFAAGLLDFDVDDLRIADARKIAKSLGLSIRYAIRHLEGYGYAELVAIELENDAGEKMNGIAASIGGGMAKLLEVNGIPVDVRGSAYEIMLYSDKIIPEDLQKKVISLASEAGLIDDNFINTDKGQIYEIRVENAINPETATAIRALVSDANVKAFFYDAILTVSEKKKQEPLPFTTAAEMDDYMVRTGKDMYEAAVDYEMARSGWTKERIMNYAVSLVKAMRVSAEEGMKGQYQMTGYSVPHSGDLWKMYHETNQLIPLGVSDNAACYSMAVMELNSGMGRIVTCPTAGSSGIMPGVLLAMMDALNLSPERAAEGFMVGGLIGMFTATLATFDGADGGCQAEISTGVAMAAATATYLMGGTSKQIENAAVLSFESLMGLICDPIAAYPEVPCILRNPMGSSVAMTMANLAMCGYDPFVPLDEIIIAMMKVGTEMPAEFRGMRTGTCMTPTGKRIAACMAKQKAFNYDAE